MKSKIIEEKEGEIFPLIARLEDDILTVLFTSNYVGTVIIGNKDHELGEYNTEWIDCKTPNWEVLDKATIEFYY
jgi:hypothetical protein